MRPSGWRRGRRRTINAHCDARRAHHCDQHDLPRIVLRLDSALESRRVCLECCGVLSVGRQSLPTAALCMRKDFTHVPSCRLGEPGGGRPSPTSPAYATLLVMSGLTVPYFRISALERLHDDYHQRERSGLCERHPMSTLSLACRSRRTQEEHYAPGSQYVHRTTNQR